MSSQFRVAVINDEIGQDFGHAVDVASREFGMQWIELRGMWNKNILKLDSKEVEEARNILERARMRVTDIASPVFKVDWPGAPLSKAAERRDTFNADFTFKQQDELLDRSFELAKAFNTDRVRIFDFWRLDDQTPYRAAIDDKMREAADKAAKKNIILILENEFACNVGTAAEAARVLNRLPRTNLQLIWDPANAFILGERPFPDGYALIPRGRFAHVHVKDCTLDGGRPVWAPPGTSIDWAGQVTALLRDGYQGWLSLETHWRGPSGDKLEASTICARLVREMIATAA